VSGIRNLPDEDEEFAVRLRLVRHHGAASWRVVATLGLQGEFCFRADGLFDAGGLLSTFAMGDVVMPWDARAAELEALHGPYCVYAAWCEWFDAWNERQSESMQLDVDGLDKTALFSAFMSACAETRSVSKGGEHDQPIQ